MALRLIRQITTVAQILRWPNLVMVAVCLYLFHILLHRYNPVLTLDGPYFGLFIAVVLLITASGYLVNDHFDQETDRINKPNRIARYNAIQPCTAWQCYLVFTGIGAILAFGIAYQLGEWPKLLLYPFAVSLLYVYARQLKGNALFGNILVSTMTAGVPLVLLIPEWNWIQGADLEIKRQILIIFSGFAFFSFVVSLFRELIKDLEDIQGDREAGWMTVPVRYGQQFAIKLANSIGFIIITMLLCTPLLVSLPGLTMGLFILGAIVMIWLLTRLVHAEEPPHFHQISQGAKILLVIGLLAVVSL